MPHWPGPRRALAVALQIRFYVEPILRVAREVYK